LPITGNGAVKLAACRVHQEIDLHCAVAGPSQILDMRRSMKEGTRQHADKEAITSKIKHAIKPKTSPARLAQLMHN